MRGSELVQFVNFGDRETTVSLTEAAIKKIPGAWPRIRERLVHSDEERNGSTGSRRRVFLTSGVARSMHSAGKCSAEACRGVASQERNSLFASD
jgi:hypothetical protein